MENILLIGTGPMAVDYTNVLKALSQAFTVIGRGVASAKIFEEKTGILPVTGGIDNYLLTNKVNSNTAAIIATGTEALMPTLLKLVKAGIKKILIEKPAAISIEELLENQKYLKDVENSIFVAYNRRFYASVNQVKRLIYEDGGLQSMHFEFTEWAHKIEPLEKAAGVKENWFFANSTHVIDTAFFIAGSPSDWCAYSKSGAIDWHPKTNFSGAGITKNGVLFSYISNWESAGRWNIELLTKKRRIYLKPIEMISTQTKGSLEILNFEFENKNEQKFKPGIYNQVEAFLIDNVLNLKTLAHHFEDASAIYSKIIK